MSLTISSSRLLLPAVQGPYSGIGRGDECGWISCILIAVREIRSVDVQNIGQ
jgi:hypothetical protein